MASSEPPPSGGAYSVMADLLERSLEEEGHASVPSILRVHGRTDYLNELPSLPANGVQGGHEVGFDHVAELDHGCCIPLGQSQTQRSTPSVPCDARYGMPL